LIRATRPVRALMRATPENARVWTVAKNDRSSPAASGTIEAWRETPTTPRASAPRQAAFGRASHHPFAGRTADRVLDPGDPLETGVPEPTPIAKTTRRTSAAVPGGLTWDGNGITAKRRL
jgi:hypothetical protein